MFHKNTIEELEIEIRIVRVQIVNIDRSVAKKKKRIREKAKINEQVIIEV